MSESYRDNLAWQKSMQLVTEIYATTKAFPRDEIYGLSNQLRRAAVSVPSNIAEGKGRYSKKEYVQFLFRARGSLLEVETQLQIARNLDYVSEETFAALLRIASETGRVLNGLITKTQDMIDTAES
jgi:four helix bundle protein